MSTIDIIAIVWTLLALALVPTQMRTAAPYGRHAHDRWGPSSPNRLGWTIMEVVSLILFVGLFTSAFAMLYGALLVFCRVFNIGLFGLPARL